MLEFCTPLLSFDGACSIHEVRVEMQEGPRSSGPVAHHILLLILNRPPPCLALGPIQGRWGQARWFRDWPPGGQLLGAGSSLPSHLLATAEDDCGRTGTRTQAVMNMKGLHFCGDEYYKRDRKEGTVDCARNVHESLNFVKPVLLKCRT